MTLHIKVLLDMNDNMNNISYHSCPFHLSCKVSDITRKTKKRILYASMLKLYNQIKWHILGNLHLATKKVTYGKQRT